MRYYFGSHNPEWQNTKRIQSVTIYENRSYPDIESSGLYSETDGFIVQYNIKQDAHMQSVRRKISNLSELQMPGDIFE